MKIGILDDERVWADQIKKRVDQFLTDKNLDYEVLIYDTYSKDLPDQKLDILFLDIDLGNCEDGFDIADKFNLISNETLICFTTSHSEFARKGYRYNAFRYIDKEKLEEVDEAICAYLNTMIQEKHIILTLVSNELAKIKIKDICYVETYGRKVRYALQNGVRYVTNEKIQDVEIKMKNHGFFMIQRSYVVNLSYVESYNSRDVILLSGEKISISRKYVSEFKKAFFEWRLTKTI